MTQKRGNVDIQGHQDGGIHNIYVYMKIQTEMGAKHERKRDQKGYLFRFFASKINIYFPSYLRVDMRL